MLHLTLSISVRKRRCNSLPSDTWSLHGAHGCLEQIWMRILFGPLVSCYQAFLLVEVQIDLGQFSSQIQIVLFQFDQMMNFLFVILMA